MNLLLRKLKELRTDIQLLRRIRKRHEMKSRFDYLEQSAQNGIVHDAFNAPALQFKLIKNTRVS